MAFIDELITVCSNYDDFLEVTLPTYIQHAKRVVVVTSDQPYDRKVREMARYHQIECVATDLLYNNKTFAKGKAINRGLDMLSQKGWICLVDCDVWLPEKTSHMLRIKEDHGSLPTDCIYGVDRIDITSAVDFKKYLNEFKTQHRWSCLIEVPRWAPLMGRYSHQTDGYLPIGFFQLWHGTDDELKLRYPEKEHNAIRNDVMFSLLFPASKRRLIPEIIALHLNSIECPLGANWDGRQTPPFNMDDTERPSREGVVSYYDPRHPRFQKKS